MLWSCNFEYSQTDVQQTTHVRNKIFSKNLQTLVLTEDNFSVEDAIHENTSHEIALPQTTKYTS